jgi:hypothetical protein
VTIINNQDCAKYLEGNTTNEKSIRTKLRQALEDGINIGLTCSTGDFSEETELYSVSEGLLAIHLNFTACLLFLVKSY